MAGRSWQLWLPPKNRHGCGAVRQEPSEGSQQGETATSTAEARHGRRAVQLRGASISVKRQPSDDNAAYRGRSQSEGQENNRPPPLIGVKALSADEPKRRGAVETAIAIRSPVPRRRTPAFRSVAIGRAVTERRGRRAHQSSVTALPSASCGPCPQGRGHQKSSRMTVPTDGHYS
ncbi:hypothetical protein [Selenomonas sp. KH1T6]|uniref:hypothetical protein n=1 Tax=Selenomonas sp. KH1T6 TaxID=3158784 RepID=UPI001114AE71